MNEQKILDISWATFIKVAVILFAVYIIYSIRDILIWFLFALVISVLFNPVIDFLQKRRIPRILGAILVYTAFFGVFSFLIYLVIPLFIYEIKESVGYLSAYLEKISPPLKGLGIQAFQNVEDITGALSRNLETMSSNILNVLFAFFGGVFTTLFVIVTAIFISLEEKIMEKALILIFPKKYEAFALNLWERSQKKVAGWFGARMLACLFVGVATYVTLLFFNVKYPFTLGLFAGVFNFVPYVGSILTTVVFFFLIFPISALKAIFVLIAFVLIQQIDNNIISPVLMKKIVGLPPVLVLVSLVIGGKLWGVLGAILIIPLAGIVFEFLKEFLQKRKDKESVIV